MALAATFARTDFQGRRSSLISVCPALPAHDLGSLLFKVPVPRLKGTELCLPGPVPPAVVLDGFSPLVELGAGRLLPWAFFVIVPATPYP